MVSWRKVFLVVLVMRLIFHTAVAVTALIDMRNFEDIVYISGHYVYIRTTLAYIVASAVGIALVTFIYPWRNSHRSRLMIYGIVHFLYVLSVIFMVYFFEISDLRYIRKVYEVFPATWFVVPCLVLDVMTFIAAFVTPKKTMQPSQGGVHGGPIYYQGPNQTPYPGPYQVPLQGPYQGPYQEPYQGPHQGPYQDPFHAPQQVFYQEPHQQY